MSPRIGVRGNPQQEYYIGEPGGDADMGKMAAKKPVVIAFNG